MSGAHITFHAHIENKKNPIEKINKCTLKIFKMHCHTFLNDFDA